MYKVFDFPRMVNGELVRDTVILFFPKDADFDQLLHRLGLDYCVSSKNHESIHGDLSFAEFLENVTPEMLATYGMAIIRPNDIAIQVDDTAPLISRFELESYQEASNYGHLLAKKICKAAEQFARRLETQRMRGHPAISTWSSNIISVKAVTWADQYANGNEPDLAKFFEKKLQEARPHSNSKDQSPADADMANDFSEG